MAVLDRWSGSRWVQYRFDPKQDYEAWLCTDAWAEIREAALERADRACEACCATRRLQVHHKHYKTFGNERPQDVQVLCAECHVDEHINGEH